MEDLSENLWSEDVDDLVRIDLIEDFPEMDRGHSRDVYRITTDRFGPENYGRVLKVSKDPDKSRFNMYEFQTWQAVKSNNRLRQFFCPIRSKSPDFRYIIMDFADPDNASATAEFEQNLRNKIAIQDLPQGQLDEEIINSNVGYHRDYGSVMIDYPWGGKMKIL